MNGDASRWNEDEQWQARLATDAERLDGFLSAGDREVVDEAVAVADAKGALDFLVVSGSGCAGRTPCRLGPPARRVVIALDLYHDDRVHRTALRLMPAQIAGQSPAGLETRW